MLIGHVIVNASKNLISYSNPFILIDFEQMDFNWRHACDMHSPTRRIKYFLHMQVHAASSDRSCENAHLYRLDLAIAARMYVYDFIKAFFFITRPEHFTPIC